MEFLGLTRSADLEGEDGGNDLLVGISLKSVQNGIEKMIQITLADAEQKVLYKSANAREER